MTDHPPGGSADSHLQALVGAELSSVVFVRDYLQLDFDGPRLTLYVWPQVVIGDEVRRLGDLGYRDALCALIGQVVRSAADSTDTGLLVILETGSVVTKPEPAELSGPEIATLSGFTDSAAWMVWRPGERPFDGPGWS